MHIHTVLFIYLFHFNSNYNVCSKFLKPKKIHYPFEVIIN